MSPEGAYQQQHQTTLEVASSHPRPCCRPSSVRNAIAMRESVCERSVCGLCTKHGRSRSGFVRPCLKYSIPNGSATTKRETEVDVRFRYFYTYVFYNFRKPSSNLRDRSQTWGTRCASQRCCAQPIIVQRCLSDHQRSFPNTHRRLSDFGNCYQHIRSPCMVTRIQPRPTSATPRASRKTSRLVPTSVAE